MDFSGKLVPWQQRASIVEPPGVIAHSGHTASINDVPNTRKELTKHLSSKANSRVGICLMIKLQPRRAIGTVNAAAH